MSSRRTVATPTKNTIASMKIAIAENVVPNRSAWAIKASAITAPDRTARKMFTRPSDSWYVSARVARSDQCSVARICSFSDTTGSRGGSSVTRQVPRQVGERRQAPRREKGGDAVMDAGDRVRVHEGRGADLHRAASGDEELERVLGGHDPADANHRDVDRASGLVREVHGERPDRGP